MATSRSKMEKRLLDVPRGARIRLFPRGSGGESVPGRMLAVRNGEVSISSPRHEGGVYRTPIEHVERFTVLEKVEIGEPRGLSDLVRGVGSGFIGFIVSGMILFIAGAQTWPDPLVVLLVLACTAAGFYVGYHRLLPARPSRPRGLLSQVLDLLRLWRRVSRR